ncbi:MAG: ABC transporter ATP-binding protein [Planctomycetota bacterium]
MSSYWKYARMMLRYRKLIAVALVASLLDAATAVATLSTLLGVFELLFEGDKTLQQAAREALADARVVNTVGDVTHLADHLPADAFQALALTFVVVLVLGLIGGSMRFLHQALTLSIAFRVVTRVRSMAFRRLLETPWAEASTMGTGDNLARVVADTSRLARGFNALMGKAVRNVLLGVAYLGAAVVYNWQLTGIFLAGAPVIFLLIRTFGRKIRKASKRAMKQSGNMLGAMQESMQALPVVRAYQAEGYERRRFHAINKNLLRQELKARTARALSSPVVEFLAMVGVMGVAMVAAWYVQRGSADPGDVFKVLAALALAGASLRPLANLVNDLQEAGAAAERVDEVLQLPVEPDTRDDPEPRRPDLPRHAESVRFESVRFRYRGAESDAIDGVDLDAHFGQLVALVGPNGSGKSTLTHLLTRLIDPQEGRVTVDGHPIVEHRLRSLRKQIAVVSQNSVLFEGTIADNIAYGRRHAPRAAIEDAAKQAEAHDFVASLPDGYDTRLGEAGAGLSGGQRQRLCIARAILRDPAILILDEATSQIDTESEARIAQAIARFRQGRTVFLIAHRMSNVVDADCIAVMDQGRIVDRGKHDELMDRCDLYRTLWRA